MGRLIRAIHRYASIALIVTAAIHGWRTFVMRRFAGPRRMPWATGVFMVAVLWVVGVTGYWLIWDERAQVLNDALTRAIGGTTAGLGGIATTAETRVAGMNAEEYLRESILDPDAYVVEGFPTGQMVPSYLEILTGEDIDNLVAFLLTLE